MVFVALFTPCRDCIVVLASPRMLQSKPINYPMIIMKVRQKNCSFIIYSTVTLLAKFLGISTSLPSLIEISSARSCVITIISKNSNIG